MKRIAKRLYQLLKRIDEKHIKDYSYETAPYCGHHYNGHKGKYTEGNYHEGMGSEHNIKFNWFFNVGYHSEEGYFITFFPFYWYCLRWVKTFRKRLTIKRHKNTMVIFYKPLDKRGKNGIAFAIDAKKLTIKRLNW